MPARYWLLFYDLVDDYIDRRTAFRAEHLGLAHASHERGELLLAGALAEPPDGAVLVFSGDDASFAEDFAAGDPYVLNGLVTSWRVRAWTVVVGADEDGGDT
ncbi:MAG TPA: YciI-like protein [Acidimicrobiales bacterium]|nr:YciI-like protein [Acidimicrobiales bacterium]